jgi:hypothetical protein
MTSSRRLLLGVREDESAIRSMKRAARWRMRVAAQRADGAATQLRSKAEGSGAC